jgi:hypothetical protein
VVVHPGNAAFALLLVSATTLEVLIMRRRESTVRRGYAYASLAAILAGFAIWNASRRGLCDPHSLIQGHAAWHILCAVSAYFLYRYYASEEPLVRGLRSAPSVAGDANIRGQIA